MYLRFSKHLDFYCINELLSKYYLSTLGITQGEYLILGDKAGNDVLKLFLKWQKEIKKSKEARKTWSIRLNAMAKFYIDKNDNKIAEHLYWLAIKLYPFWRGNYIDIINKLLKI